MIRLALMKEASIQTQSESFNTSLFPASYFIKIDKNILASKKSIAEMFAYIIETINKNLPHFTRNRGE